MQDTIDVLKNQKQEEIDIRKSVEEKSKDSFRIITILQDKVQDFSEQILNHQKNYKELKMDMDAKMTKFHDMTRAIQSLRHDNNLLYKHKASLE